MSGGSGSIPDPWHFEGGGLRAPGVGSSSGLTGGPVLGRSVQAGSFCPPSSPKPPALLQGIPLREGGSRQRSVYLRSVTSVALGWGGGGDPYLPAKPLGLEGGTPRTPLPFPSPVPTVVGRGEATAVPPRSLCHSVLILVPRASHGAGEGANSPRTPPPGFFFIELGW